MPARPSVLAGLLALALVALSGCASSGPDTLFARDVPFPSYASAEPVQGMERSTICHQGRTITIVNIAVAGHMDHGDYFGACNEDNRTRHARYYTGEGEPAEPEAASASTASAQH